MCAKGTNVGHRVPFLVLLSLGVFLAAPAGAQFHSADTLPDFEIDLSELLRVIQFYNSDGYHCEPGTEDNYDPGAGDQTCANHDSDYNAPDWAVSLSELLRLIQIYNARVYGADTSAEDGYAPIFDPEDPTGSVTGQFGNLRGALGGLGDPAAEEELGGLLDDAETDFLAGEICSAADILSEFADGAQELYKRDWKAKAQAKADVDAKLFAFSRTLQFDMVLAFQNEGGACSGFERLGMSEETGVGDSDATGLTGEVVFGLPRFSIFDAGAKGQFTGLHVPRLNEQSGGAGLPGIPSVRKLVAVPPGAFVQVAPNPVNSETMALPLMPAQPDALDVVPPPEWYPPSEGPGSEEPPDSLYATPSFALSADTYGTDRAWPPNVCQVTPLGRFRGMEMVQLDVFGGQYNPVQQQLTLFEKVEFDMTFSNSPGGFLPESSANPFESRKDVYTGAVLNKQAVLAASLLDLPVVQATGEEFMVLTHPDFEEAAEALAAWKRTKGIMTNVYLCGTGSGITGRQTAQEIDDFIEAHIDASIIKASYILLLGDAEFISPFQAQRQVFDPAEPRYIGTDWFYAERTYVGQEFPTLIPSYAVGRIPVDTLQQANDVVSKIIDYEQSPPGTMFLDTFYDRISLAAEFQCCRADITQEGRAQRTFTEMAEWVRPALVARGYNVERLYRETIDTVGCPGCDPPIPPYTGDPTPRRYYNGTALPSDIGPSSGFTWDAGNADVVSAFNEGRFLFLHRDHGWSGGWSTPSFNWSHMPLSNGEFQPVVFSINCSSGLFDNEVFPDEGATAGGVYFAERLLRQADGGAIGIIGDTRVSPSWPNTALAAGLFDAIWPETIPSFGDTVTKRRLGDILNHAKLYLVTQCGTWTSYANLLNELYLYHVIGDPTLEIWTADPDAILLAPEFALQAYDNRLLHVTYGFNGAQLTAYQYLDETLFPLGRAEVEDGIATMALERDPIAGVPVLLSANVDNAVPVSGSLILVPK